MFLKCFFINHMIQMFEIMKNCNHHFVNVQKGIYFMCLDNLALKINSELNGHIENSFRYTVMNVLFLIKPPQTSSCLISITL